MGKVLVVAYYFPPVGGVGILRTLKYATYLPEKGWEPIVLTARNPSVAIRDEEAERALPATLRVERVFSPEPAKLRRAIGRVVLRGRRASGAAASATAPGTATAVLPAAAPKAPKRNPVVRRLSAAWAWAVRVAFFPDEQVGWAPFAARRGMAINRATPLDVVYSSSLPISCHLAAGLVAKRAHLPWVADFRDPWIGHAYLVPPRGLHAYMQRRIERRIVHLADRIVFPTAGFAEAYAHRYPGAAGKLVVIANGYDRNDLAAAKAWAKTAPRDGRFHLVYGGSLYGEHELEIFLGGLELLVARKPEVRDRLTVDFIGWLSLHNQAVAAGYATPDRLGRMLTFAGFLPHKEAVARLATADALLTVIADEPNKGQIQGGKLMEYIGLDRPILAVVPEGDARALLRDLDWGVAADPTPEGVADGLERLLDAPAPTRRADPDGRYDRENLAGQLATQLDGVVAERTERAERNGRAAPGTGR
jgi:glycosyltransferase involved in cell wall biosynthesis